MVINSYIHSLNFIIPRDFGHHLHFKGKKRFKTRTQSATILSRQNKNLIFYRLVFVIGIIKLASLRKKKLPRVSCEMGDIILVSVISILDKPIVKTLICGFGSIGRRHLNNLRTLGETEFVLLRSHQSTLEEGDLNGIPVETEINSALAHHPDAIIVSNPTALHLGVAIPTAQAGCAILLEKPISHDMQRVNELQLALEENGNRLLVGFQFRFHPVLRKVKELLLKNDIGRITSFRAHWGEYLPGWHPWEDYRQSYSARLELGGGVVNTLSHPLDYLRWFFGNPSEVWALTSSIGLGLDVEDTAEIGLCYSNGMTGSVHLDYIQQPPEHTFLIIGTDGTITFDNASASAVIHRPGKPEAENILPPAGFERNQLFLDEMRHFQHVVSGKELPACTFDDGIAALKITLAVHQSAGTGQLVRLESS